MSRILSICAVLVLGTMACGSNSSSGVSSSKKLAELSVTEQDQLCDFAIDAAGGARTVTCGDGGTVTISVEETCAYDEIGASCEATVGDAERCAKAQGKDPCSFDLQACGALLQCAFSD